MNERKFLPAFSHLSEKFLCRKNTTLGVKHSFIIHWCCGIILVLHKPGKQIYFIKNDRMKKGIFALLVFATGYAVSAQEVIMQKQTTSGTYNAYSIPEQIRMEYQLNYGDPVLATWHPRDAMWVATTKSTDNRITHVYYSTEPWYMVDVPDRSPVGFRVTLPQINNYVPEDVITSAINQYGNNIYSITQLKATGNVDTYQVGLIENGVLRTVSMDR
jgi:hypothetical protein